MSSELLPINLPRLPLLSAASQRGDQRASLPDVRASGVPILTTSGRAAIALGLEALGVGDGDRVLVPTYHCPTMVAPVARVGATPVFFPINDAGEPDLQWLVEHGGGAKAILVAHYFGVPRDLAQVRAFCDERDIALIEDCAHAFFGLAGDRPVGAWGDVVAASLTKFFPSPDGGLLVLRSRIVRPIAVQRPPLLSEIRGWLDTLEMSARYGRLGPVNGLFRALFGLKSLVRGAPPAAAEAASDSDAPTVSACLDERVIPLRASAAARWVMESSDNERIIRARQRNYRLLVDLLEAVAGIRPVIPVVPASAVPYVCPIEVRDADAIYSRLRASGVPVFRWDVLWPGTPSLQGDVGRHWSRALLQVACHQDLSEDDMRLLARRIVATLAEFKREQGEVTDEGRARSDVGRMLA